MGNFAGSAVSPRCARSLTTSPSKRARCSTRACRRKRHSTGTSCRRTSRIFLCFPGDSPSARRSRSFTQSGRKRNRRTQGHTNEGGRVLGARSEEHTSELQSLAYLVCRLLLLKK